MYIHQYDFEYINQHGSVCYWIDLHQPMQIKSLPLSSNLLPEMNNGFLTYLFRNRWTTVSPLNNWFCPLSIHCCAIDSGGLSSDACIRTIHHRSAPRRPGTPDGDGWTEGTFVVSDLNQLHLAYNRNNLIK